MSTEGRASPLSSCETADPGLGCPAAEVPQDPVDRGEPVLGARGRDEVEVDDPRVRPEGDESRLRGGSAPGSGRAGVGEPRLRLLHVHPVAAAEEGEQVVGVLLEDRQLAALRVLPERSAGRPRWSTPTGTTRS